MNYTCPMCQTNGKKWKKTNSIYDPQMHGEAGLPFRVWECPNCGFAPMFRIQSKKREPVKPASKNTR